MSRTLSDLQRLVLIEPVPVMLGPRDQRFRRLYWTKEFHQWWVTVEHLPSRSIVGMTDQLNQAFADFISGRPMTGMARCDPPTGEGVWKIKTPDLRLFGWAPEKQVLVLAAGELKRVLRLPGPPRDKDLGKTVVQRRRKLGVTIWVNGDLPNVFRRANS